jgi:hypothetical protein
MSLPKFFVKVFKSYTLQGFLWKVDILFTFDGICHSRRKKNLVIEANKCTRTWYFCVEVGSYDMDLKQIKKKKL